MSLKNLTAEKHREAENSLFMKSVFAKTLPQDLWIDWTYQKWLFYGTLEGCAGAAGLLNDLPDIRRAFYLFYDFEQMNIQRKAYCFRDSTKEYHNYILSVSQDPKRLMAHVYTWHMGDLFGGQMIRKTVPGSHRSLEFADRSLLINNVRTKIDDSMAEEANCAFSWAIRMMREYDRDLEQNK